MRRRMAARTFSPPTTASEERFTIMRLCGRNIVITGGTSGIGLEVVKRLHVDNRVMVVASDARRLQALAASCDGIMTCRADLSRPEGVAAAAAAAREAFPRLHVLINNAAVQHTPGFLDADFDEASIQREIAVNLTAPCRLTALLLPVLLHDEPAAVVNVNSGLGLAPKTSSAVYCATKGGLNLFSQSLRHQLAGTCVQVLQAFMPMVETPMTAGRAGDKITAGHAADQLIRGIERGIRDHDIGKVKLLRGLLHVAPGLARRIMRRA